MLKHTFLQEKEKQARKLGIYNNHSNFNSYLL